MTTDFLLICLMLLVLYTFRSRKKSHLESLPCPPGASLLWGHELEAFQRDAGEFYTEYIEKYGPTYRIKGALGHADILILADPTAVAHLSRNIFNYRNTVLFQSLVERVLGRGLPWVQGEIEHRKMRRLLSPAFTAESVKLMSLDIYDAAERLQARLRNQVSDGDGTAVVNILDYCAVATLDIIGRVGFGHDFGQGVEGTFITETWNKQVSLGMEPSGFMAQMVLRLFPFLASLPLSVVEAQGEIKNIIKRLGSQLIDSGRGEFRANLLSILARENSKERDPMSKDELLDHINTFVMVGHESSAIILTYTLWELSKNPEKQQRLREEVTSFAGDPTYDDFQTKLPYLDACCKEGLRAYPSGSHFERVAATRDTIPLSFPIVKTDGSKASYITVEGGQVIYIPAMSMNRLKSIWGDGDEFRPERWLEADKGLSNVKIEGWNNIYTFLDGPRTCMGYRLAVFELKILMLVLIRHFIFHDTGVRINSKFSLGLHPFVVGQQSEGANLPIKVTLA